jgi:IMP dehydrogenase
MQTPFAIPMLADVAYTYNDYLILPSPQQHIEARTISTQTQLTDTITLNIPIVGANMGHLGGRMAEKLAQLGGIGILSQDFRLEEILQRIRRVKEANPYFYMPIMLSPNDHVADALSLMQKRYFDCVIAIDNKTSPVGLATEKDLLKLPGWEQLRNVMRQDLVIVPDTISTEEASKIMLERQIHHLPVVNGEQKLVGCLTPLDVILRLHGYRPALDKNGRLLIGVAMGMKAKEDIATVDLAHKYLSAGVDVLVLDVANGYLSTFVQFVENIRRELGAEIAIIAGNVADYAGAMRLLEAGCNTVKVGIGPGGACTTRQETGVGVPQASAVQDAVKATTQFGKNTAKGRLYQILADGGIRSHHDVAVAILLGAPAVMIGSMFAGTYESAFETDMVNGEMFKRWRGNASSSAATYRRQEIYGEKYITEELEHSEGADGLVRVTGSIANKVFQLIEGLKSYMARSNSPDIKTFQSKRAQILRLKKSETTAYTHLSQLKFANLYIKPQPSQVVSRKIVQLDTALSADCALHIPYVALPADFVQKKICTIMAQLGGIGFVSRKKPQEDIGRLIERVTKVKSCHSYYFFPSIQEKTEEVGKTLDFLHENAFSCAIIVQDVKNDWTPIGIATYGDLAGYPRTEPLGDLVKTNIVTVPEGVDLYKASAIMLQKGIHHLPVVNLQGKLVGCITPRDVTLRVFYRLVPNTDKNGRLRVGAALSVGENVSQEMERVCHEAMSLQKAGSDLILLDSDNGYSIEYLRLLQQLRGQLACPLVAAGISTYEGAIAAFASGADIVKVGSQSIKVPYAEAVYECARAALLHGKKIISDDYGDLEYPRDANFSLLLGANAVGMRGILAPTYENSLQSAAAVHATAYDTRHKWSKKMIGEREYLVADLDAGNPMSKPVLKVEGSVVNVIVRFLNGLRSSCTYSNAATLEEYQHRAQIGMQSPAGYWEGMPHAFLVQREEKS